MADCCPPGSTPYLEATYTALGHVEKLDAVELYLAPVPASVTKGLLLIPDVCKLLALRRTGKTCSCNHPAIESRLLRGLEWRARTCDRRRACQ